VFDTMREKPFAGFVQQGSLLAALGEDILLKSRR
jgi:hypothetical protein